MQSGSLFGSLCIFCMDTEENGNGGKIRCDRHDARQAHRPDAALCAADDGRQRIPVPLHDGGFRGTRPLCRLRGACRRRRHDFDNQFHPAALDRRDERCLHCDLAVRRRKQRKEDPRRSGQHDLPDARHRRRHVHREPAARAPVDAASEHAGEHHRHVGALYPAYRRPWHRAVRLQRGSLCARSATARRR